MGILRKSFQRMTPAELAAAVYQQEPCARSFREDLEAHLLHGYVFSTPDVFLMIRPVDRGWRDQIVDPTKNPEWIKPWSPPDCWHVYLAAGDIQEMWKFLPYPLEFVSYERSNRLRIVRFQQFRRLCSTLPTFTARIGTPP